MRATIFDAIYNLLDGLECLKGSDGTVRIYKYPRTEPEGYPAVSITSIGLTGVELDNQRDKRTYIFNVRLVQEKMAETGFTPEKAERVAREREDEILAAFDANNDLDVAGVLRVTPTDDDWGYLDSNTRIVIDFTIAVEATAEISQ